jgi:iron complex outermembrane receptor protein
MKRIDRRKLARVALAVGLQAALAQAAAAQQADAAAPAGPAATPPGKAKPADSKKTTTLQEITVTSRQRSERLQDVPIAVTAFDAKAIVDAGITRTADYINQTSNVNLTQSNSAGFNMIEIRGITQARSEQSPVAVVVDGVQEIDSEEFPAEQFDIDRIEVLKGPQSALYGVNAIAGAINITTTPPPDVASGYVQGGIGNGDLRRVQGGYGGPLDKDGHVRYQVSGFYSNFDGLIKNNYLHNMTDNLHSYGTRLRLIDDVTDRFTMDYSAGFGRDRGGGMNWIYQPLFGVNSASDAHVPVTTNNHGRNIRKTSQLAARLSYRFDAGTLASTTSWDRVSDYFDGDSYPYSPGTTIDPYDGYAGEGTQTNYYYIHGVQQELRFTSNADSRFRWIAGLQGLLIKKYYSTTTGEDLGLGIVPVYRSPNPATSANPTTQMSAAAYRDNTYSAFGQIAYDLLPNLEASVAARYEYDLRGQVDQTPPAFDAESGLSRTAHFHGTSPRFSLTWKPDPRYTLYASYAKGFISGGWNQSEVSKLASLAGLGSIADLYQPETARSYELGVKSRPADWLELDGEVYLTHVSNQEYYVYVNAVNASLVVPIERELIRGFELDGHLALTRDLELMGSYGYTQSRIQKYTLDPGNVGNEAPYIPRYTGNIAIQYTHYVSGGIKGTFRVDYRRTGAQYWDPGDTTARQPIGLLGARVTFSPHDDLWSLSFWGKNLRNQKYLAEYVLGGYAYRAEPRTFGVDFRWNFL